MARIDYDAQVFETKTADEMRAMAVQCNQSAEDSFQRCDTDGFLSQWASNIQASKLRKMADLKEANGLSNFPCLMFGDRVVAERIYTFANPKASWLSNEVWKLPDDLAEKFGRKWIPVGSKSTVQKKLGLYESTVERPAVVIITCGRNNNARGLSGAASAYVAVVREDEAGMY